MLYDMKQSGANIQRLRIQKGYTQEELSGVLNITRSFLSYIESGKKGCSIDLLIQLSELFQVSLDYLVFGSERYAIQQKQELKENVTQMIRYLEQINDNL